MVQYSDFLDNFNVTALQEFVSWEQIQEFSEQNNIKPDSTLALASFIGNIYYLYILGLTLQAFFLITFSYHHCI